jgi:hypothetical protein
MKQRIVQDDIILNRAVKSCELEVDDESSTTIHRLKI